MRVSRAAAFCTIAFWALLVGHAAVGDWQAAWVDALASAAFAAMSGDA